MPVGADNNTGYRTMTEGDFVYRLGAVAPRLAYAQAFPNSLAGWNANDTFSLWTIITKPDGTRYVYKYVVQPGTILIRDYNNAVRVEVNNPINPHGNCGVWHNVAVLYDVTKGQYLDINSAPMSWVIM